MAGRAEGRPGLPWVVAATVLAAGSAAALLLPWWRAGGPPPVLLTDGLPLPLPPDARAGWEVVGGPVAVLLVALAPVAVVATAVAVLARTGLAGARTAAAAAGAAGVAAAGTGLVAWPGSTAGGAWVTGLAGLAAVVLAVLTPGGNGRRTGRERRTRRVGVVVTAVALVTAVLTALLPGVPRVPGPAAEGPFVRLAVLDARAPLRAGEPALGLDPGSALTLALDDGGPVVVGDRGVVGLDPTGRARVVARTEEDVRVGDGGRVLGVAAGRVARLLGDTVLVTGLAPGDPTLVAVPEVAATSPVGSDGSVWLRGRADPPGTLRRLDLDSYDGGQRLPVVYLPVVTVREPEDGVPVDVTEVRPVDAGALRVVREGPGTRLERLAPTATGLDATRLAGAPDPACGLTSGGPTSLLPDGGPVAVDAGGGTWLPAGGRLVRLAPDGVLRAVPAALPGPVTALLATPDGAVVLATRGPGAALWRMPDAAAALADLPPVPADCVADPPAVGPPVVLVPVANTAGDPVGSPLGADGRFASGDRGTGAVAAVPPGGAPPVPLGTRDDGATGPVWPDGSGGAWWLETADELLTPVHAPAGGPLQRLAPVPDPAPREGAVLLPDLGGAVPLLAGVAGAFALDGGTAARVADGPVTGGVVRADGRGWVLSDGRLLALDAGRVTGAVIDAGPQRGAGVPVVVQLARGVAPDRLDLPGASVGLDATGRAVVLSGGVVLAVDDAGAVRVVAQDRRLDRLVTVEGGLVDVEDGVLRRVELPG
ncbi:hypothetical protein [Pseudonocardia broussonetiae]|uniref:Uncharacterized protein n=1 Tax=Pseudonocardia broussonetiae TaxID=2736640 RepID=A0A6M6JIA4_9PSEU|nr:hypothetical protein [Pseudonocardia broussonetiae]QJY47156.1 hypothetical protein HOP40_16180 [Pseudonocardia broussonetiae]